MRSRITQDFIDLYRSLPPAIRLAARRAYRHWRDDPSYPGVRFKIINPERRWWSARVTRDYRAVGTLDGDLMTWFWIGSHDDYDRLINP